MQFLIAPFFSKEAVQQAHQTCVDLGYPAARLVFANYNWSGSLLRRSEVSVSFYVAETEPTQWVHVILIRPTCFSRWSVTAAEEAEVPLRDEQDEERE